MTDGFDIPLRAPLPLSAEDAYWHACTGTPWEPEYVFVHADRQTTKFSARFSEFPGIMRMKWLTGDELRERYPATPFCYPAGRLTHRRK